MIWRRWRWRQGNIEAADKYNKEELEIERAGLDRSAMMDSQLIRGRIAEAKARIPESRDICLARSFLSGRASKALEWEAQARFAKTLDDEGKIRKRRKSNTRRRLTRDRVSASKKRARRA